MQPHVAKAGLLAGLCLLISGGDGAAQKSKDEAPPVKVLDRQVEQRMQDFFRETAELAREYERAGELQKSKRLLRTLLKLNPKIPGVKEKIKELDETLLSANPVDFELDVGRSGWGPPRGMVFKGEKIRIQASGRYKFIANATLGPNGFSTKNPQKDDMAAGVPCGALMGAVVTEDKVGKPFAIGASREYTPKKDGLLFLRANLPPDTKSNGRLKVRISGHIRAK